MGNSGTLIRILLAAFVVASPALGVLVLSAYFDLRYLQPLAATEKSVASFEGALGGEGFVIIDVFVAWGRDWPGPLTQAQLQEQLSATLHHQTELYRFEFEELPGEQIEVTFTVGPNSFGPFPPGEMVRGIELALIALRITNGTEAKAY